MIHRFGLYIIAAFLSFALSSIETTIDDAASWAVGNLVYENLSSNDSETFFIDDTDAGCASLISNDATNRIYAPSLKHSSPSRSHRLSVRRISSVYNVVIDNGDNAIHNALHSLICLTHSRHSSSINDPARYLIRLRKFVI